MPNKEEKPSQAVVIADSFNRRFFPLSYEKPRCLIPLVNVPLIDYTIEALSVAKIQEIYIFCQSHHEKVKEYIQNSKWSKSIPPLHIQVISSPDCKSLGDALREIDAKRIIHGDFVLLWGDTVTNMNLQLALDQFKALKEKDKNAIMMMILKESQPNHRSRERGENGIFLVDSKSNECLAYEQMCSERPSAHTSFDIETFCRVAQVDVRYDCLDCQIDICSPDVLALFTENFDYQNSRQDFVRGVLSSEILGSKIYCHFLQDEYAVRVRNTHLYDSVSKDILGRWAYPFVPDVNFMDFDQNYRLKRACVYMGEDVSLARSVVVGENVVLGHGSSVGAGTRISNSVIGPNCQIGRDCVIEGAYLWNAVVVADNCSIIGSILACNVVVKEKTTVKKGSIISFNAIIGPSAIIPEFSKITKVDINRLQEASDSFILDEDSTETKDKIWKSQDVLGAACNAFFYEEADCNSDDEVLANDLKLARQFKSDYEAVVRNHSAYAESSSEEEEEDEETDFEDDHATSILFIANAIDFQKEAQETLKHAINSNYTVDNAVLELSALKFACNASFKDCCVSVVPILLGLIEEENILQSVQKGLGKWARLLVKFVHSEDEQLGLLKAIQSYLEEHPAITKSISYILPLFYKLDVLDEEAILSWWNSIPTNQRIEGAKGFMDWLQQSEDESEGTSD